MGCWKSDGGCGHSQGRELKQGVPCFQPRGHWFSHLAGSGYGEISSIGKFKQVGGTAHMC